MFEVEGIIFFDEVEVFVLVVVDVFDLILFVRMIGEFGDVVSFEWICFDFIVVYIEYFFDIFYSEIGFKIEIWFVFMKMGLKEELLVMFGEMMVFCDVLLCGWCLEFIMGCGGVFVMMLVEVMLGVLLELIELLKEWVFFKIEFDLIEMIFLKVVNVFCMLVVIGGNFELVLVNFYNVGDCLKLLEGYCDFNVVLISFIVIFGKMELLIYIVVLQWNFLKIKVMMVKFVVVGCIKKEWIEQIKEQVQCLQVGVEVWINLQFQMFGIISKFQVGDVILFEDMGDVKVQVNVNGKEFYFGEFGCSGIKYMVCVMDIYLIESDFFEYLIG